ncbi:helix-turn-helix domain-containing protein [Streptomyces carpaticus]|uniref:Scr1 family TA system antitoxin-like transcriptional regulator n=1 Tax=Streptomyces carpaticus TaxID=285558 RepID=A0ABV4ZMZ2_9ACTN
MKDRDLPEDEQTARQLYGELLRTRRERAGLTQEALAKLMLCSPGNIAHFERGRRKPSLEDAQRLDQILGVDDELFRRMREIWESSQLRNYFRPVLEMEQKATAICEYAPSLVPGVLQTRDYARAVYRSGQVRWDDELNEERAARRMRRARYLEDPQGPSLWAILDEVVIRRAVGGPAVMAEQLDHISALGRRGRIFVQVLPFSAGVHALMEGLLITMSFENDPDVAYSEGIIVSHFTDDPERVRFCHKLFDLGRAAAMPPENSLALIESAAEEYRNASRERLA